MPRKPPIHPDQLFDNGKAPEIEDKTLEGDNKSALNRRLPDNDAKTVGDQQWVEQAKRRGIATGNERQKS